MKTAAFIEACCRVGALVAGGSESEQSALGGFGHHIGMAFQIMDDLLDYRGDPAKTGKPRATDFREGCATWPLIDFAVGAENLETWTKVFGNGVTDAQLADLADKMSSSGSFHGSSMRPAKKWRWPRNHWRSCPIAPLGPPFPASPTSSSSAKRETVQALSF